jgi:peptide/nickel transport system substrate-binding protein
MTFQFPRCISEEKEESEMEGQGSKPLPQEAPKGRPMMKIVVAVVVIIVIIAAIAGALLLTGGGTKEKVAPTASLTASASVVDASTAVLFNASASQGQNGATISYYLWNFGDGSAIGNTTTPTVTHTYTGKPGLYQAVVTVVDNNGMSATSWAAPAAVQVLVPLIPAESTSTITLSNTTTPVWLSSSAVHLADPANSTVLSYNWTFGDGVPANTTASALNHIYAAAGFYHPTVTVWFHLMVAHLNTTTNVTTFTNVTQKISGLATPPVVEIVSGLIPATSTTDVTPPTPIVTVSSQVVANNTAVTFTGNGSLGYDLANPTGSSSLVTSVLWHFGDTSADASGTLAAAGFQRHTYLGSGVVDLASLVVTSKYAVTRLNVTTNYTTSSTYYITIVIVPPATATGGVKNPDTFTTATIGEPQTLDPAWDYETSGGEVLQNTMETLVFYDGASLTNLKPVLCTVIPTTANGGISADGLNYTFTIRQNVKFHDGNVMTTDDVVYSFKRMLTMNDVEGATWMYAQFMLPTYKGLGKAVNLTEVDNSIDSTATTVTFHLIKPCPAWLFILAFQGGSVVEKAWVQAHAPGNQQYLKGGGNGYIDRNVMGTGPYMLKTWAPNQYIVLQRWDGYWGVKPSLKFVVIQKVQDVGTREMLLLSGQADSVYVPRANAADVRGKPGVRIVEGLPTLEIDFFGMNWNVTPHLDIGDVPANFFADVHIRQAFVHAFDYHKYLTNVMLGTAIQPNGPIPQGMLGYDPALPNVTFDLARTAAELKLAINPNGAGKSYAETGFHVILYYNAGNTARQAGFQLLKDGLESLHTNASLGVNGTITVGIVPLDWPTYLDARANAWLPMFFLGWLVDYPDPDDFAAPFCDQNGAFPVTLSIHNQTLTDLVHAAAVELNSTVRLQQYTEIAQSCYDNAYYLFTAQPTTFHVERTWVQNYVYNPAFAGLIYSYFSKG